MLKSCQGFELRRKLLVNTLSRSYLWREKFLMRKVKLNNTGFSLKKSLKSAILHLSAMFSYFILLNLTFWWIKPFIKTSCSYLCFICLHCHVVFLIRYFIVANHKQTLILVSSFGTLLRNFYQWLLSKVYENNKLSSHCPVSWRHHKFSFKAGDSQPMKWSFDYYSSVLNIIDFD